MGTVKELKLQKHLSVMFIDNLKRNIYKYRLQHYAIKILDETGDKAEASW